MEKHNLKDTHNAHHKKILNETTPTKLKSIQKPINGSTLKLNELTSQ